MSKKPKCDLIVSTAEDVMELLVLSSNPNTAMLTPISNYILVMERVIRDYKRKQVLFETSVFSQDRQEEFYEKFLETMKSVEEITAKTMINISKRKIYPFVNN